MNTTYGISSQNDCNSAACLSDKARRFHALLLASLAGLALAACTSMEGGMPVSGSPPASIATVPADPLLGFAATAAPGSETVVTSASTGRPMRVRLLRAYSAASGRECREILVGTGIEERARLVCRADGSWVEARPLLAGGAGRP